VRLGAFPDVDFLYENLVFLPVHQNLTPSALRAVVETVRRIQANPTGHATTPRLVGTAAPL
jgi:dTDP-4-amino-4,6-dideoxygalactose transaminase